MTIHREGKNWVWGTLITVLLINFLVLNFRAEHDWITVLVLIVTIVFFLLILQFFRYPKRNITRNENYVIAPADGKVVVIERTEESEYYKDKRIQELEDENRQLKLQIKALKKELDRINSFN